MKRLMTRQHAREMTSEEIEQISGAYYHSWTNHPATYPHCPDWDYSDGTMA